MSELELPERLNAATVLVDAHLDQGRAQKPAILCGDRTVTYGRTGQENVNRLGNALRGTRRAHRGTGRAVVPRHARVGLFVLRRHEDRRRGRADEHHAQARDYEYLLNDSRARVLVVHRVAVGERISEIRENLKYLEHVHSPSAGEDPMGTSFV